MINTEHDTFRRFLNNALRRPAFRKITLRKVAIVSVVVFTVMSGLDYIKSYHFSVNALSHLTVSIAWVISNVAAAMLIAVLVVGIGEYKRWKRENHKEEEQTGKE